jgi:hypothetical protein
MRVIAKGRLLIGLYIFQEPGDGPANCKAL